jgi:hypothetical protein
MREHCAFTPNFSIATAIRPAREVYAKLAAALEKSNARKPSEPLRCAI